MFWYFGRPNWPDWPNWLDWPNWPDAMWEIVGDCRSQTGPKGERREVRRMRRGEGT